MNSIEIIALIFIIAGFIKMFFLAFNPKMWMNFAKGIWKNKFFTSFGAFILAGIVFYYLILDGISIVQILAVSAFVALLASIGLAGEIDSFLKKYEERIKTGALWKKYWFYVLVWIVILLLGLKEIFI